jgi:uroporphyrin-III C-methyltransferase
LSDANQTENPKHVSTESETAPSSPPRDQSGSTPRRGRVSSGLALILAFAALSVTGYLWYALIYERPELLRLDLPNTLAGLERQQGDLRGALDQTAKQVSTLTETQNTLKSAVDRVQAELGRNQTQWIVSETEQLLLIANRRLQLARDANSALAALRAADRQLELLASPSLLPVRREIAKEISTLETLDRADIAGMSLRLGGVADRVDQLPLAADLRAQPPQVAAAGNDNDDNSARSIWRDILGLVHIRRQDTTHRPLLAPEQQYFARENLRLMLYGAQHALLQGNVPTFQQNLDTAVRWLGDYFDQESALVNTAQQELKTMRATPVMNELPDITGSLEVLRKAAERQRQP